MHFKKSKTPSPRLKVTTTAPCCRAPPVTESQNAYDIAKARFDAGAIDYLNLLETQRSLYQAQDNQIAMQPGVQLAIVKTSSCAKALSGLDYRCATVAESQNAYDIAKARFDAGAIDYLTLLETQRSLYQAQDNQIAINQGQLQSFVQLRKALGA